MINRVEKFTTGFKLRAMSKSFKVIYVTYLIEVISCKDKPIIYETVTPSSSPEGSIWILAGRLP